TAADDDCFRLKAFHHCFLPRKRVRGNPPARPSAPAGCLTPAFVTLCRPMFFILSKIFWIVAAPSHWLGLLVLATALCLLFRMPRAAKACALAAVAILLVAWLAAMPLARDLESRYPRPSWPERVDGVLVLGGGY